MLHAARCMLHVACCMLHAAWMHVAWMHVACCVLCVAGRLSAAPSPCPSQSTRTAADAATIRQMPLACLRTQAHLIACRSRGMEWMRGRHHSRACGVAGTGGPSQSRADAALPGDTAAARVRTARGAELEGGCCQPTVGTHCYHGCYHRYRSSPLSSAWLLKPHRSRGSRLSLPCCGCLSAPRTRICSSTKNNTPNGRSR